MPAPEIERRFLTREDVLRAAADRASFSGGNLMGLSLAKADLRGLDFRGANLVGADLSSAGIEGTDLRWANLERAKLDRAALAECRLDYADLWGVSPRKRRGFHRAALASPIIYRVSGLDNKQAARLAQAGAFEAWSYDDHFLNREQVLGLPTREVIARHPWLGHTYFRCLSTGNMRAYFADLAELT